MLEGKAVKENFEVSGLVTRLWVEPFLEEIG